MNTLDQIESAVAELPPREQRSLLRWLQEHLTAPPKAKCADASAREKWLAELSALRASTRMGVAGMPLQQLMDDLREDRC